MSSQVFILYISFLLRAGCCLGVGFLFFNSAHVSFHSFVCGLAGAPTTLLHCSYYDIIYLCLPCYYFWVYRLKHLSCQFLILFLLLVFTAQHSCQASSFNISGFPSPFHSLSILGSFYSFLHFTFPWVFAKSFRLPWPNYHILYLWFYQHLNQSHLLIPFFRLLRPIVAFFSFFTIQMGLLLHSLGLPQPVCFLWSHLLFCGPMDHYSCHSGLMIFILLLSLSYFFLIVGLLLLLGPFVENGHQQLLSIAVCICNLNF